jgi:ubiquinone/menaquinone biosynthesis C-methylase UbiE
MVKDAKPQGGNWGARAAYWDKNAPAGESVTDDLNQILIGLTGIDAGDRVLDLASGSGEPAISIALKVGARGSVTALDAHAEMLSGAERRASTLGLTNITFEIARMEELPFDDDKFDAVTCRFGLMSSEDPVGALREAQRVLKPGRKAAFMTHGNQERNTLSNVVEQVVRDVLGEREGSSAGRRLRFSEAGTLQEVFTAAGFENVGEREIRKTVTHERNTRFWRGLLERRHGPRLEALRAEEVAELNEALEMAFAPYLSDDQYELLSTDMAGWGTA